MMVNNLGLIVHKTTKKKGRRHDYDVYKNNYSVIPKHVVTVVDLGYLGIETDFQEQLSSLPCRKYRIHKLFKAQKEYNLQHAKKRIVIEHAICKMKKYRIFADIFRNKLKKYNKVSDIVSGLVNYRIMKQQN